MFTILSVICLKPEHLLVVKYSDCQRKLPFGRGGGENEVLFSVLEPEPRANYHTESDSCLLKRGPKIFLNVLNPKINGIKVNC